MLGKILVVLVLILPNFCYAAIYQYTDSQGNIVYTNQYHSDAKLVDLPSLNKLSEPKGAVKEPTNVKTQEKLVVQKIVTKQNYTSFSISSPGNSQTFQNQRNIEFKLDIKPKLQTGDKIAVYVDGSSKSYYVGTQTQIILYNLPRGEHQLQAKLVDANNKVLMTSSSITIYVHYAAVGKNVTELATSAKKLTPSIQPLAPAIKPLTPPIQSVTPATKPINP